MVQGKLCLCVLKRWKECISLSERSVDPDPAGLIRI
jgi:hypothetical protein